MSKNKVNRGTGAGGARTNAHGINFEDDIYLKQWILAAGYQLVLISKATSKADFYQVLEKKHIIAYYGRQRQIYNALKILDPTKFSNQYVKEVLSKKIYPDAFILSLAPRRLTIFEKKWQQTNGSVDEKIQTAPFKLEMFEKLLRGSNISCQYQYILSAWFKNKQYRNVKEYYDNNKQINVFVENENLETLNIDDYLK